MTEAIRGSFTGKLKFLADLSAPLVYVPSKGGGDQTEHQGNFCTEEVDIRDARSDLPEASLDREGFALVPYESAVNDFYDDDELLNTYHGELAALLKQITGATRVEVFDDTRRSSSSALQRERGIREPANIVHNDYTAASGLRRLADFFVDSPEEAQALQREPFAIINAWRSIAGPVMNHPLVLCDAQTVGKDDLVAMERRSEERRGELQVALYSPGQRWFYYPGMTRNEVLLFKTFDSVQDGRPRFTPHSSAVDPRAAEGLPSRESLESRCLVFF
ncbi:CmcJ/NvfI family oxidoreductase [Congregibacter sp.]|uniref:CmcJ/NvfI family oxidoreductase n=1 Tax=Congregibacter sp. TaxID=2744308 RepID=UPI003F6CAF36